MFSIIKPYIFSLDPETAHDLAIKSLKFNILPKNLFKLENEHLLEINLLGKKLKNPIGIAAGFDKSAEVYNSLFKLGFGFVEVGTITPKRQSGNPKPRVFRLENDKASINRLGFNNDGLNIVKKRILRNSPNGFLGINIGPNSDTKNKSDDFIKCISDLENLGNYITVNISSPNTEGLRDFHDEKNFEKLLNTINKFRFSKSIRKPVLLKISPDINEGEIQNIVETTLKYKINGLIISNTTEKNREKLTDKKKMETGGLSGLPLQQRSTLMIKKFYRLIKNRIPIIGVGGVDSGESALEKIFYGATAVQLYTGMVYKGPTIVKQIKQEMLEILGKENIKNLKDIVGTKS